MNKCRWNWYTASVAVFKEKWLERRSACFSLGKSRYWKLLCYLSDDRETTWAITHLRWKLNMKWDFTTIVTVPYLCSCKSSLRCLWLLVVYLQNTNGSIWLSNSRSLKQSNMGLRWHEAEAAVGAWLMDWNMPIVGSFSGQKQLLSYTSFPRTGVKVCKNNASHSWIVTACCYCLECPAFSPCLSLGFNLQLLCF